MHPVIAPRGGTMPRRVYRVSTALTLLVGALVVLAGVAPRLSGQAPPAAGSGFPSKANGEWVSYNSDIKGSRYMPLDQIKASNFNKLEVAWRFKTCILYTSDAADESR